MSVKREPDGRWRFRATGYFLDDSELRVTGTAPKYDNTSAAAFQAQSDAVAWMRTQPRPVLPLGVHSISIKRLRDIVATAEAAATAERALATSNEPAKPLVPTVKDFHGVYLESERIVGTKPSTMASKEGIFRTHIVPRLGDLRLDQVTYAVIEDFKLALAKTQAANTKHKVRLLGPKTIHNVLVNLSDMLGAARKRGLIAAMPEIDWLKIPTPEFDFLDFGEADQLIAGADSEWRMMILTGLKTGMRMGELLALEKTDLDLAAGRANVRRNYVDGHFVSPKSGKGREIPLGDDVRAALAEHIKHERGPLVFCDAAGQVLTAGKLARPLMRACKRAKLREIGWHVLRHTFASHLAMRGVPLKVIQELLGHASIVTTMRYAHLAPHVARDAVRLLDRAPVAAPPPKPPANSTPNSTPTPAIVVDVAKDWQIRPNDGLSN